MKIERFATANHVRRILIVEATEVARIGLTSILAAFSRFAVCAATGDLDTVSELVERQRPALVVADPFVNSQDGVMWTKDFVGRYPKTKCIVASWNSEEYFAERVLRAGAWGYWVKSGSAESLVRAIDTVLGGELYVSSGLGLLAVHKLINPHDLRDRGVAGLSDRELHVFTLIAARHGVGQIARELGISRKTVETHCEHIKLKLHFQNAEALRRGAQQLLG